MELDLDTFLTAVYCVVDDLYRAEFLPAKPARPGAAPELSDSEVLALMALAQWQPARAERRFVAYAARHWRALFPRLPGPGAVHRRARGPGGGGGWGVSATPPAGGGGGGGGGAGGGGRPPPAAPAPTAAELAPVLGPAH